MWKGIGDRFGLNFDLDKPLKCVMCLTIHSPDSPNFQANQWLIARERWWGTENCPSCLRKSKLVFCRVSLVAP
jgi:hypothetical protein